MPATLSNGLKVLTVRDLLEFPDQGNPHDARVGNQTRQEIIRFVTELRGRFPDAPAARPKDQTTPDETTGPPSLEALEQRTVGVRSPKKEAEWNIRAGLLGRDGP